MKSLVLGIIAVGLIGAVLAYVGIVRFRSNSDELSVSVDKQRTSEVIEEGKELGAKAIEQAEDAIKELRSEPSNSDASPDKP